MAINDKAVFKPGVAHFYTNPEVGAALPADLRNPTDGWVHMGHTSLEDIIEASSDGGDLTILGSLQKRNLRSSRAPLTEGFTVNLLQLDEDSLKFYAGANVEVNSTDGRLLGVPESPEPTVAAWYVVITDGTMDAGLYTDKAEFMRADDFAVSDTESLMQLPVTVTPLGTGKNPYSWIKPHEYKGEAPGLRTEG